MNERIKLDPLINKLVRFKLHELDQTKEGVIRAFDEQGYWIQPQQAKTGLPGDPVDGGSLAEYLKSTSPCTDAGSSIQFLEFRRIQWFQKK